MFRDAWNPTLSEIEGWARGDYYAPEQDWELALDGSCSLLIRLVDDPSVSAETRTYLLGALYTVFGDGRNDPERSDEFERLLAEASTRCEPLRRWATRSRELLAGEREYTYDEWGLGANLATGEKDWFERDADGG